MDTTRKMARVQWRESSYNGDAGGECVECAPLGTAAWRESSYSAENGECAEWAPLGAAAWHESSHSTDEGGECVEVARLPGTVAVRDSKDPERDHLTFSAAAFGALVQAVAAYG